MISSDSSIRNSDLNTYSAKLLKQGDKRRGLSGICRVFPINIDAYKCQLACRIYLQHKRDYRFFKAETVLKAIKEFTRLTIKSKVLYEGNSSAHELGSACISGQGTREVRAVGPTLDLSARKIPRTSRDKLTSNRKKGFQVTIAFL